MNKEFIPYEEALALKELGFDEPCFGMYYEGGKLEIREGNYQNKSELEVLLYSLLDCINAPLCQQVFRWFRKKYGLHVEPVWDYPPKGDDIMDGVEDDIHWTFVITEIGDISDDRAVKTDWFNTYEEAELACLKKLIEIVKNGK